MMREPTAGDTATRHEKKMGRLFVSFGEICLDNLPEGTFRHSIITADEARRRIEEARQSDALLCAADVDLGTPYPSSERARERHTELAEVLREHEAPCIAKLEAYLDEYLAAAGIGEDTDGALFRTTARATGTPHRMAQAEAYRMIRRRAKQAGITTRVGNHSLRATGITAYLKHERGRWNTRSRWPGIPRRAPPSSTTGARMRSRSMSMKKSGFSVR